MKIFELRRNPDQNPRQSVYEFLKQYKDDPDIYIHTTDVDKVGINPRTRGHDAPMGIFAFRLQDVWKNSIERWNTGDYSRGLSHLPYNGGDKVFVLRADIPVNFVADYTEDDLNQDIEKIKTIYNLDDDDIAKLKRTARTNLNFINAPAGYLWGITKAITAGVEEFDEYTAAKEKKWSLLLRNLGHSSFNDPGYGFIHGAESAQALFLDVREFEVVDSYQINRRKSIEIGDKTYQSAPRKLHMKGIPNTFFYNNTKKDFANVRLWVVDYMELDDVGRFQNFLPWNAIGYIKQLGVDGSSSSSYPSYHLQNLSRLVGDDRIKIDRISLGYADQLYMLLRNFPTGINVDEIYYHSAALRFTPTALDSIDSEIKSKLVPYG